MEKKKSTRKSKVKIYTEKGGLKGYSISDTMVNRRSILKKLLRKTPYSTIIKRLNVLAIYNKNRYPETSSKIKRDMSFLQKTFSKKRSVKKPSAKKRSVKKRSVKKRSVKKGGKTMKGMCCCRRQCRGMCRWQGALPR
jgi:hypothetical protein